MGIEIERKFLVLGEEWKTLAQPVLMRQAYLSSTPERVVRVRIENDSAYLTIKGRSAGISRSEWEYAIPLHEAQELIDQLCEQPVIEKQRYRIPFGEHIWEVDEFFGENVGLCVAEVELRCEQEPFLRPTWVGEEVSDDHRYANAQLFKHPYSRW